MYSFQRDKNGTLYAWEVDIFGVPPLFFTVPPATRQFFTYLGKQYLWNAAQGAPPANLVLPIQDFPPGGEVPVVLSRAEQQASTPLAPKFPTVTPTNINVPLTNRPPVVVNPSAFNPPGLPSNPAGGFIFNPNRPFGVPVSQVPFGQPPGTLPHLPIPGLPIPITRPPTRFPGIGPQNPPAGATNPNANESQAASSTLGQLGTLALVTLPAWGTLAYLHWMK